MSNSFNLLCVFKGYFNKCDCNFDGVSKIDLLEIKVF